MASNRTSFIAKSQTPKNLLSQTFTNRDLPLILAPWKETHEVS
jgi:hypothetical protein